MLRARLALGVTITTLVASWIAVCTFRGANSSVSAPKAPSVEAVSPTESVTPLDAAVPFAMRCKWRLVEYVTEGTRIRLAVEDAQSCDDRFCTLDVRADSAVLLGDAPLPQRADVAGTPLQREWRIRAAAAPDTWTLETVREHDIVGQTSLNGTATLVDGQLILTLAEDSTQCAFERVDLRRTTVFLVHGTYGATADWTREVPEAVTFASELRRAMGAECTRIEPFLWRTSVQHAARKQAAADLAELLDDERFAEDRAVLVGHSHGGNVCLAASGLCRRPVELVVCLSTPHAQVITSDERQQQALFPVYLTPSGRRNIGQIVNVWAQSDPVVAQRVNAFLGPWAAVRTGLEEQTAIREVHDWRRERNFPRLVEDGSPIRELLTEMTGARSTPNLVSLPRLACADRECELACESKDLRAHDVVHSCRMGRVLGAAIRDKFSAAAVEYLSSLVLTGDSDTGGPLSHSAWNEWWRNHRTQARFDGWLVKLLEVRCKSKFRPDGQSWDPDGSWPETYVCWKKAEGGRDSSDGVCEGPVMRWQPWLRLPPGATTAVEIRDRDPISTDDLLGQFDISGTSGEPPPQASETEACALQIEWLRSHH